MIFLWCLCGDRGAAAPRHTDKLLIPALHSGVTTDPKKPQTPKRPKEICCRRFAKGICALVCTSFRSLSRGCHLHLVPVTSPINTTARRARPNSPPLPADLRPGYRKHYDCCDICWASQALRVVQQGSSFVWRLDCKYISNCLLSIIYIRKIYNH